MMEKKIPFRAAGSGDGFRPARTPRPSLTEEIITLDEELIRLLGKRSLLMRKLRGGKAHASTHAASLMEKKIRQAWEDKTGGLSRDPRIIRRFFDLLRDVNLSSADAAVLAPFNLAPARLPVAVDMPGPVFEIEAQLWLALAALTGQQIRIFGTTRTDALQDGIRALSWCGAKMDWIPSDGDRSEVLECAGASRPDFHSGAILVGEDALTMYLLAFFGISQPGRLRFIGGTSLKEADLSALGHFLPSLGARLAWVVPGSKGLPVNVECSGLLPEKIQIPADLPLEGVLALLWAAVAWADPVCVSLALLPQQQRAWLLGLIFPLFERLRTGVRLDGECLDYPGAKADAPLCPTEVWPVLDVCLCAFGLALPLFAGGKAHWRGIWPDSSTAHEVMALLSKFPLLPQKDIQGITCVPAPEKGWPEALDMPNLSPELHPLFWLLNARLVHKFQKDVLIRRYPEGAALTLAEEFLAQAGFVLNKSEDGLRLTLLDEEAFHAASSKKNGWSSPNAFWGLALSLAAFMRANIKLNNPDCIQAVWPEYWQIYNKLPDPRLQRPLPVPVPSPSSARRRIIVEGEAVNLGKEPQR
ncbi:MAG: hypothetical protein LBD82_04165 [Deltaproteobacteria bacterium]|jgi:chorismate mutase|nr:hypothetical protein [Deltaproteobacteria bacterium]